MMPKERPQDAPDVAEGEVRCKLFRDDGTVWTVTDLSLDPGGLRVSGYRYIRDGHTAAEARRDVLEEEALRPTDRVRCLNRKGAVVWTLHHPDEADRVYEAEETGDSGV